MSSASAVYWALEELGVPYEKVLIDLKAGDSRKPEFLTINPNGKVPAIVHDGTTVFESGAIQIYLGETFGVERGLFPEAGPKRGAATSWIVWCSVTLVDALARFGRNNVVACVDYLRHANVDLAPYRAINAWAARCVGRPARARAQ